MALSDKLNVPLRSSKSTGQTQLGVMRGVIMLIFLLSYNLFRGLEKVKPKLVNLTTVGPSLRLQEKQTMKASHVA